MRENIGISRHERWTPVQHPAGTSHPRWHISNDITRDNVKSIIEIIEDLFA